ncbi:rhodanese-like domain-containing protein [Actinacidiphila rubida]|uniref:Rhodanese-related sulfurtransferase n=1 Tax=Actinacidiphila rubida TaxID=310780 RepID=A0A1H8UIQ8_9ACTN|nr:rhodanese-like domain-containing protein [Actinacidiphila rubida]SEP02907.1 Rhodanese-related sulfurtransferase [Actinacidiphila rubida]
MTTTTLTPAQAIARLSESTVVDVRSPGEYASGHLPGAHNIPLDRLNEAADALRAAARRAPLLMVCASGARSAKGCAQLGSLGIEAATLEGGTSAWAAAGNPVEHPVGARNIWPMDRQVRLAAGSLVLVGSVAGLTWSPAHWLSGAIGAGLLFSGVTNACGMAAILGKLPYNRAAKGAATFEQTLRRVAP